MKIDLNAYKPQTVTCNNESYYNFSEIADFRKTRLYSLIKAFDNIYNVNSDVISFRSDCNDYGGMFEVFETADQNGNFEVWCDVYDQQTHKYDRGAYLCTLACGFDDDDYEAVFIYNINEDMKEWLFEDIDEELDDTELFANYDIQL